MTDSIGRRKHGELRARAQSGDAEAAFELGSLLREEGDLLEAKELLHQAFDGGHPEAGNDLAVTLIHLDEIEAAFRVLEVAAATDPQAEFNLAQLHYREGHLEQAAAGFRRQAELGGIPAMNNLGAVLDALNRVDEAAIWIQQAAESGAQYPVKHYLEFCQRHQCTSEFVDWAQGNILLSCLAFAGDEDPGLVGDPELGAWRRLSVRPEGSVFDILYGEDREKIAYKGCVQDEDELVLKVLDFIIEHGYQLHIATRLYWDRERAETLGESPLLYWDVEFACEVDETQVDLTLVDEALRRESPMYVSAVEFLQEPKGKWRDYFVDMFEECGVGQYWTLFENLK